MSEGAASGSFSAWFSEPLYRHELGSPVETLRRLHDMAWPSEDAVCVLPPIRRSSHPARYRFFGECQDLWVCSLRTDDVGRLDAPVYFESTLDLIDDHGVAERDVLDGDRVLVADRFDHFVGHMLALLIGLRGRWVPILHDEVCGALFRRSAPEPSTQLAATLNRPFPAGFDCKVGEDVIWISGWGAAFRNPACRSAHLRHVPDVALGPSWQNDH